jgi:hypothetical protein
MNRSSLSRGIAALCLCTLALCTASPANAQIVIADTESGWQAVMTGLVSVWTGAADWDVGSGEQSTFRVTTGFNPSKLEFIVKAPESNGVQVSAYFQLATSIQGFKTRRVGEQIEVRGASIDIAGGFGTFQIGRNFAIYSSNAIFNDTSSMRGTGWICVGPDGSGPNCGHIGTGYTWSDWTAGVRYFSPRASGFQVRLGVFDPIETAFGFPGGDALVVGSGDLDGNFNGLFFNFTEIGGTGPIETDTPLFELEANFNKAFSGGKNNILLWAGVLNQSVDDLGPGGGSGDMTGVNVGGRLKIGNFGLTGNIEETEGIAEGFIGFGVRCDETGCDSVDGDGWYVNADYTAGGKTTFGFSYGEGSEDANAVIGNGDVERDLWMAYVQHQVTPNLNVNLEIQEFSRETTPGFAAASPFQTNEEYSAVLMGGEFRF